MDGHGNIPEQPLSAREKLLREKIVRLENQLQGYKSQIDILDDQRQKLEERTLNMESSLTKTKKELLEAKKEVLDKELAEIQLSEELKSMTLQAEEYKRLFMAESSKNRCGIDRLEALISNVDVKKVHEDAPNRFESFKELITVIQEGFQAQIKMVLDKLSDAEDKLCGSLSNQEEKAFQNNIKNKIANGSVFVLVKPSKEDKGQDDGRSHFEPAIPPTGEIQAMTGTLAEFTHENYSSYTSTEHEDVDKDVKDSVVSAPKATVQFLQTQPPFSPSQTNVRLPTRITGRRTFAAKSPLMGAKTAPDEDCVLVYEARASIADREKAHRFFLPPNFFNYTKYGACPGCIGCCGISKKEANSSKEKDKENKPSNITRGTTENVKKPGTSFSSVNTPEVFQKQGSHKLLEGSGQQLFAEIHTASPPLFTFEAPSPTAASSKTYTESPLPFAFGPPSSAVRTKASSASALPFAFGTPSLVTASNKKSSASPLPFTFGAPSPAACNKTSSASPLPFTFGAPSSAAGHKTSTESQLPFTFEAPSPTVGNKTSPLSFTFGTPSTAVYSKTSSVSPLSFTLDAPFPAASNKTSSASPLSFTFAPSSSAAGNKTSSTSPLPFTFRASFSAASNKTSTESPLSFKFEAPSTAASNKTSSTSPLSFTIRAPSSLVGNKTTSKASLRDAFTFGAPVTSTCASYGHLTFLSQADEDNAFAESQKKDSQDPCQEAGQQLFAELAEQAKGQDDHKLHFEAIIPLPDKIQVVTGEEGLEVLFTERAKLYRFNVDSGQWKERGVGEVKLLRHPTCGRGRVLMRREQIKKLCANHNITAGMELKPNVGSDRSWVWYTSADYSEGEARQEKLAIKFKTPEIAEKFKHVFDDLKETSPTEHPTETATTEEQKDTGCKLYEHFISTFPSGAWSCEVCYVDNKAEDSICAACNSVKPGGDVPELSSKTSGQTTNASVVESVEPTTFQELNKEASAPFFFFTSQLFTIGRGEPSEDKDTADDEIKLSPSKTSSLSKHGITPTQKSSAPLSQTSLLTGLPFGTGTPSKFTFSLQVSPGSPPRKPKSPLLSTSPLSPGSPVHGDDDEPHFEPLIPLPEKVECHTGEEGQELLFCERCKLFRYDSGTSQWKERGVGDIKILRNPSSGRYRVLMRREHVLKLCANHVISADMELKSFPNSDRAWLWTTLADFSEDVTAAETVAARFRTNQLASRFKEIFEKAFQTFTFKPA